MSTGETTCDTTVYKVWKHVAWSKHAVKCMWNNQLDKGYLHDIFFDRHLNVPCSNLAIKMAKQNSQVIWISSHQMKPISQNMYLIVLTPIHRYTSRIRPIFSNQLWETPNNDVMTELCACPWWEFQQHASRTLATLSIDQSLSMSHCQCTSNSHHTLMINHYFPKKIIILQDFIYLVLCSCWM